MQQHPGRLNQVGHLGEATVDLRVFGRQFMNGIEVAMHEAGGTGGKGGAVAWLRCLAIDQV